MASWKFHKVDNLDVSDVFQSAFQEEKIGKPLLKLLLDFIDNDTSLPTLEKVSLLSNLLVKSENLVKYQFTLILMEKILNLLNIDWDKFLQKEIVFKKNHFDPLDLKDILNKIIFSSSIAFFYIQEDQVKETGRWFCDLVSLNPTFSDAQNYQARQNLLFYLTPIKYHQKVRLEIELPYIFEGSNEKYLAMNPSILKCTNGYLANIRAVNFKQEGAMKYFSLDPQGIIRTKNYLVGLDNEFNILWQTEVIDKSRQPRYNTRVRGLEDIHLFWLDDQDSDPCKALSLSEAAQAKVRGEELTSNERFGVDFKKVAFSCVTADTRTQDHGGSDDPQVSVGHFDSNLTEEDQAIVEELIPLVQEDDKLRCEKNWLFFQDQDHFECVYQYYPFMTLEVEAVDKWASSLSLTSAPQEENYEHQSCLTSCVFLPPLKLLDCRGSAGPVKCNLRGKECQLIITHGVIINSRKRNYYHRLLAFDLDWKLEAVSRAFYFDHIGVEYCAGMTIDHQEKNLLLTFGHEDSEAWLYVIDWSDLEEMFYTLDQLSGI